MEVELAKQISVSSSALLLVKLKETKYSSLHFKPSLRIIVLGEKEIHNTLESREEVTSRFSQLLFVFCLMLCVMGVYSCRFGVSESLGLAAKPGCSSGGPHRFPWNEL